MGEQVEKQYYVTFKVEHLDGSVTTHKALEGTKWADWIGSSLDDLTQEGWTWENQNKQENEGLELIYVADDQAYTMFSNGDFARLGATIYSGTYYFEESAE